ncbi:MAG: branched-chain-amino-acid transaminase, partial [Candidatus Bathyarchaeia archaeon]
GVVFKLREHVDRLYRSAQAIMLEISLTRDEMVNAVLETLRKNNLRNAYIRLIVTRGVGDLGVDPRKCPKASIVIIAEPVEPLFGKEAREKGIVAIIASTRRDPPQATTHEIKSMNYLNSILAKLEAIAAGANEAIMLDMRGFVSEAPTTNLFMIKAGRIFTPPTTASILHGITRERIIKLGQDLGYEVIEKDITVYELFNAEEVFLCGTHAEITPVVKISGRVIGDGNVGPVTKRIIEEFQKITKDPREGVPIYSP